MLGSTLTLLHRSLKQDSRLLFSHLTRLALIGFAIFMLANAHQMSRIFGAPGLNFFSSITYLNFIFISISGVSFFASAITEEKEEMTLGLLRMAGVSPVALLVGKSSPRLIGAIVLLTLQFPFTLLAITLGGVTMHQVLAAYWALLAFLLALGNVALFASVVCATSSRASWMTAVLLGLFLMIGPVSAVLMGLARLLGASISDGVAAGVTTVAEWLQAASIWHRISAIMTTGFAEPMVDFQVISNVVVAIFFFALSWATFGYFVRDDQPTEVRGLLLFKRADRMSGLAVGRAWFNALMWKDFHFLAGGVGWLIAKFILYGMLVGGFLIYFTGMFRGFGVPWRDVVGPMVIAIMLMAIAAEIALIASRVFREEVRSKTHAGLMMLPQSLGSIVYSKVGGCLLGLIPATTYFIVGVLMSPETVWDFFRELDHPAPFWFVSMYLVFVHLTALFSLFFKWGGLPFAFGTVFLFNGFCMMPFSYATSGPDEAFFAMMAFGALVFVGFLHFLIAQRLRVLAAE